MTRVGDTRRGALLLLWAGAAVAALAAHAGLAVWAIRAPSVLPHDTAAPAAVMIELAPSPVAPEALEQEIAPDLVDAPEIPELAPSVEPPPRAPLPDQPTYNAPPERAELEMPAAPEVPTDPVVTAAPDVTLPELAANRPVARPENLPRPEPERVAERQRQREPSEPSQARRRAQVEAPPAAIAAAPESSRGSAGAVSPAEWQARLAAHLERRKRYPNAAQRRRLEGVAHVHFTIDAAGNVLAAGLARSSGHSELDAEVLAMIQRASPVPPPPPGAPREITAPVQFTIR